MSIVNGVRYYCEAASMLSVGAHFLCLTRCQEKNV